MHSQQFNSSAAWPIDSSLLDSEGTNKVLGKENDRDSKTFPTPVTEYVTPLAFSIHARLD